MKTKEEVLELWSHIEISHPAIQYKGKKTSPWQIFQLNNLKLSLNLGPVMLRVESGLQLSQR